MKDSSFYKFLKNKNKLPTSKVDSFKSFDYNTNFTKKPFSSSKINLKNYKLRSKVINPPAVKKPLQPWYLDFKFLITSLLIFIVTQVFLNFSAYKDYFYVKYLHTFEIENQLQTNAFKSRQEENLDSFITINSEENTLPLYDFEVMPTDFRILIPNLNINVPVQEVSKKNLLLQNWKSLEVDIQNSLKDGVIHYPGTPTPDISGNFVITGHSSYYPWSVGRYKDVFAVLHNSMVGDQIIVYHNQRKYIYQIQDIRKVLPKDIQILADMGDTRITLITCTPIGSNYKRLVITAFPVASVVE